MADDSVQELYRKAVELQRLSQREGAQKIYEQLILASPAHADAHHMLGLLYQERGQTDHAIQLVSRAIALNPRAKAFHFNLAMLLQIRGRLPEAAAALREGLNLGANVDSLFQLGQIEHILGNLPASASAFQAVLSMRATHADAACNLGSVLEKLGRHEEAIALYRRALEIKPDHGEAHINLTAALIEPDSPDLAREACAMAVLIRPELPELHNHLGVTKWNDGVLEDAISSFRQALSIRPDFVPACVNLAGALKDFGETTEAMQVYEAVIEREPENVEAHFGRAQILLQAQRFEEGWREFEWRRRKTYWMQHHPRFENIAEEVRDWAGRRVLLHAEQGYGDTIQFLRFAQRISAFGASVTLQAPASLVRLLRGQPGIGQVIKYGQIQSHDLHIPLMSLPHLLNASSADRLVAPSNYIRPDSKLVQRWQARLRERPGIRVGLNWAGNADPRRNRKRTIGLRAFQPLRDVANLDLVSLQLGTAADEMRTSPLKITDFRDQIQDFADTAALISTLDAIVTCDTSVAHLAGALGVPAIIILPWQSDWRWFLRTDRSPWYKSATLLRQDRPGEWISPIAQLGKLLAKCARREPRNTEW